MLVVLSAGGSPGASTFAAYLSLAMAAQNRETLLLEADPNGGSLARKLGIQVTPGAASLVASGLPLTAPNLVEHSQDVLFSGLHVMPGPSNPAGARSVATSIAAGAEMLADVSDGEMGIVVDGGRVDQFTAASGLVAHGAGLLVVAGESGGAEQVGLLAGAVAEDPAHVGPIGLALTIGTSSDGDDEWQRRVGLHGLGSLDLEVTGPLDFGMFMGRNKRRGRVTRERLAGLAEELGEYAFPAMATTPRPRLRVVPEATEQAAASAGAALAEHPASAPSGAPHDAGALYPEDPATAQGPDWSTTRAYSDLATMELAVPPGLAAPKLPTERPAYPGEPAPADPYGDQAAWPPGEPHLPPPAALPDMPSPAPGAPVEPELPPQPPSGSFRSWAGQMYEPDHEHDSGGETAAPPPPHSGAL